MSSRPDLYAQSADAIDHLTLECGAAGYSEAQMAACIGVAKRTLRVWAKRHPRYAEVLERAETMSQAWWEGAAQDGRANNLIGGTVWHKSVSARFPEQYADRQEVGKIGETERTRKINWNIVDPKDGEGQARKTGL